VVGPAFKGVRWLGALAVGDVENPGFPGLERGHGGFARGHGTLTKRTSTIAEV
jgi:hypothetical protein